MSLADDLRDLLVNAVKKAPAEKLGPLLLTLMRDGIVEDRRAVARPRNGTAKRAGTAPKTCKEPGCGKRNKGPRFGYYCADHAGKHGYGPATKKKAAKKR